MPTYPRCFLGHHVFWIVQSPNATPEVRGYDNVRLGYSAQWDETELAAEKEEYMGQVPPPPPALRPAQAERMVAHRMQTLEQQLTTAMRENGIIGNTEDVPSQPVPPEPVLPKPRERRIELA